MALSAQEMTAIKRAALSLSLDAPSTSVENFISRTLGLNQFQQAQYFPTPDPAANLEIAIAELTQVREETLRDKCDIPNFAIYGDPQNITSLIAGFNTYLMAKGNDAKLCGRVAQHAAIRSRLKAIKKGHHLEAVAAAILNEQCIYGEATKGSGDQGIDALGWKELILIDPAFSHGSVQKLDYLPGEKVFLLASSKAVIGAAGQTPSVISPAHIRELVGSWIIQRTEAGQWRGAGIRMLSPVQMILVTTYRLSFESKSLCNDLGIQVWGIPELIYLICKHAPDAIFDAANNYSFSTKGFRAWWERRHLNRISVMAT